MSNDKKERDKVIITPDYYIGKEEWYRHIIECPKCGSKQPAHPGNYCSGCGIGFKISPKVAEWVKSSW